MTVKRGSYLHQNFRDYAEKEKVNNAVGLAEHDELVKCQKELREAHEEIARLRAIIGQMGG